MSDPNSSVGRELYFIMLALVLAFGILQTTGTVFNTEKPVVSVVSCSMYPEYDRGDVLFVNGVNFDSINEGDVIVYDVPLQASVNINQENYRLGKDAIDTPAGSSKVLGVDENDAILSIDGERLEVREGGSYTFNSAEIQVESVSGMDIPVVHRVIEKRSDSLETKGDANPEQLDFEKDIRPEQIHGQVFFRIPKVGAFKLVVMDIVGLSEESYSSCSA